MKKQALLIAIWTCLIAPSYCNAQVFSLEPIQVTGAWGTYTSGYGFGFGVEFYGGGSGGSPTPGYPQMVALINQQLKLKSVRCSGSQDLRNVTSLSDPTERWLAAESVFRAINATFPFWQRVFGKGPFPNGQMEVAYADGGTETFLVTNYWLSSAFPQGPVPNSLVPKDGVIRPDPLCG